MTREEAIKILKAIRVYECYPKSAGEETKEAIDMAIEALKAKTEGDLISRQDAIDLWDKLSKRGRTEFDQVLMTLPSADAVEVVRCKDCMYRHEDECPMQFEEQFDIDDGDGYYDTNYIVHDFTQDDGYCSWGERMSND